MTGPPATPQPDRTPSAAHHQRAHGGAPDDTSATQRHQHHLSQPRTPAERVARAELVEGRRP